MRFPVFIRLFGLSIHPHLFFETLAYFLGFQLYLLLRRRDRRASRDGVSLETHLWVLLGCIGGAFLGSKLLAWAENFPTCWAQRADPATWLGPKTIVGGLIGGWVGTEIAKRATGVRRRVGDLVVFPVMLGMAVGRLGCFFTGLADGTCGAATGLPWGVDLGDGVRRHPAQLYDIVFLAAMAVVLLLLRGRRKRHAGAEGSGLLFRLFLLGYCGYRFFVEFLKPTWKPWLGCSAIQAACLGTALYIVLRELPASVSPRSASPELVEAD